MTSRRPCVTFYHSAPPSTNQAEKCVVQPTEVAHTQPFFGNVLDRADVLEAVVQDQARREGCCVTGGVGLKLEGVRSIKGIRCELIGLRCELRGLWCTVESLGGLTQVRI